jgi:hypothetical protein
MMSDWIIVTALTARFEMACEHFVEEFHNPELPDWQFDSDWNHGEGIMVTALSIADREAISDALTVIQIFRATEGEPVEFPESREAEVDRLWELVIDPRNAIRYR